MKAFKFACPVCGQHINADSDQTGSQLECPTCYQQLIVPQAPESDDPKFIISAAQVRKARPTGVREEVASTLIQSSKKPWLAIAAALVMLGAVAAAALVFHDSLFKSKKTDEPVAADKSPTPVAAVATAPKPTPIPVVVADDRWKLDVTEVDFPDTPVVGKIHGVDFTMDRAYLQNGTLILRHDVNGTSDLSIGVTLAKQGETMAQHFSVTSNVPGSPKVQLRWKKDDNSTASLSFTEGYAMKLELGYLVDGKVDGKIYLCTPDDMKSFVCGTFSAEVKMKKAKK